MFGRFAGSETMLTHGSSCHGASRLCPVFTRLCSPVRCPRHIAGLYECTRPYRVREGLFPGLLQRWAKDRFTCGGRSIRQIPELLPFRAEERVGPNHITRTCRNSVRRGLLRLSDENWRKITVLPKLGRTPNQKTARVEPSTSPGRGKKPCGPFRRLYSTFVS